VGLSADSAMLFLLKENNLNKDEAVFVGSDNSDYDIANLAGVDFLSIK
jgi:phosphoglycolate phosphatase-like HAD superfamily hydrolase